MQNQLPIPKPVLAEHHDLWRRGEERNSKATASNGWLFIHLVQKCSVNRDTYVSFSWLKLECGLFSNLAIRPEVPGNADNEEHTDCGHVPDCPMSGEKKAYRKICRAFTACNLTTGFFCSLVVIFCSFVNNAPASELSTVGWTRNSPSRRCLAFLTLYREIWRGKMKGIS